MAVPPQFTLRKNVAQARPPRTRTTRPPPVRDSMYTPAVALTHLLHCPERGINCPCPRCQSRLAAAL
eukprot:5976594-Pleurochrysis_carterae.AAC.1